MGVEVEVGVDGVNTFIRGKGEHTVYAELYANYWERGKDRRSSGHFEQGIYAYKVDIVPS